MSSAENYKDALFRLLQAANNVLRMGPDGFLDALQGAAEASRELLEEDAPACDCGRPMSLTFSEGSCWECPVHR